MNFPRADLDFLRLQHDVAEGLRVAVVTPNRRLAIYLKREYDDAQRRAGRLAWDALDIMPLPALFEKLWRAMEMRAKDSHVPQLLTAMQCQFAWEDVVRTSDEREGLLNVSQAAKQALAAWQLAHAWRLLPALRHFPAHEDVRTFQGWMQKYQAACREKNWIDGALLPDCLLEIIKAAGAGHDQGVSAILPAQLFVAGFDIVTPQQQRFFSACAEAGVDVQEVSSGMGHDDTSHASAPTPRRLVFDDEAGELRACAAWARHHLASAPAPRIAIVVPGLEAKRNQVTRALLDALLPLERSRVGNSFQRGARFFNVSLGQPLADYALVHDALSLIEFSLGRALPFLQVSALMRSPHIAHAVTERAGRAMLDAALREMAPPELSLFALQKKLKPGANGHIARAAACCEKFCAQLDRVAGTDKPSPNPQSGRPTQKNGDRRAVSPQDWVRHFGSILAAWGFPGETALESIEHQVLVKFREALGSLATLQALQVRMKPEAALAQLRRVLADTVFQPESIGGDDAPIQVLGILESAGQRFDALWVTGLSNDVWPLAVRPNPFIPAVLQRNAGVTEASAAASLALDRRITAGWSASAAEVIFSHAIAESGYGAGEQPREASALIAHLPSVAKADVPAVASAAGFAEALQMCGVREIIPDLPLEPLANGVAVRGGATVIRDQAACPFRAFARHRLSARPLKAPHVGLDAAERGTLLHRALSLVWGQLRTHAALVALDETHLAATVKSAVVRAVADARGDGVETLTGRFADLEESRLCRLIGEWLQYERERAAFEVIEREQKHMVGLGGLSMQLRLDRMDRLADGTHALIDYKTGVAKIGSWLGDRPDEPQLPLYFVTAEQAVSAVAFARVRRGEQGKVFGFEGVSAVEGLLPDVAPIGQKRGMEKRGYTSWDVLVQEWESSLAALAGGFVNGAARVDPKHGGLTCAQCDLQSVCRIAEIAGYATQDLPAAESPAGAGADTDE